MTGVNKSNDRCDVLHFLWSGGIGGVQTQVSALVRNAAGRSRLSHRACFFDGRGRIAEALAADGLAYLLPFRTGSDLPGLWSLVKLLRRLQPRVLHFHTHALPAQLVSLLVLPGAIRVYSERSSRAFARDLRIRILYRLLRLSCSRFIANSPAMGQCMEAYRVAPDRITLIPNGVAIPLRTERPAAGCAARTIGVVARLTELKRVDLFLEVLAELKRGRVACSGVVVGDGRKRAELSDYAKALGIEDDVRFVGEQVDVASWFDQFDVLVMTPSSEPFGNVALEAMARGVPVVAMPCQGGLSDLVRRGGLLLADREIATAADAVAHLLGSADERERLRVRGFALAAGHSLESVVMKLEDVYQELEKET